MTIAWKWAFRILATAGATVVVLAAAAFWWSFRDTTLYAAGFTEEAFQQLEPGMGLDEVYSLVGQPLAVRQELSPERWCYGEAKMVRVGSTYEFEDFFRTPSCVSFSAAGLVFEVSGDGMAVVRDGMAPNKVLELLGEPQRRRPAASMTLHYTKPGGEGLFRARIVAIDARDRISEVVRYQFYD